MTIPTPLAPDTFDVAALPDRSRGELQCQVCDLPGNEPLAFPVLAAAGRGPGPRLAVVAGVHGDEADGIAAALALWEKLSTDFIGRVTIIPVANPMAFAAGRRRSPIDDIDLNRVCPGRLDGSVTERLAAALSTLVCRNADFLFTLHGWYSSGYAHPHVEFDLAPGPTQDASRHACIAAGYDLIVAAEWPAGLLPKAAVNAGIPAMESEIGGQGVSHAENVGYLIARIRMLMAHLGMTSDPEPNRMPRQTYRHCYIAAPLGGLLRITTRLGQSVRTGDELGQISDLWGRTTAVIMAPEDGVLVTERRTQSVGVDDNLFTILVPTGDWP